MKKFKGYISSRKLLNGDYVTQKTQNLIIRETCKLKNFNLELSSAEYIMENSFMVLNNLIKNIKKYDGVAFFSLFQLPSTFENRNLIYKNFFKKKKLMFFCNEKILLKDINNIYKTEDIIKITSLLSLSPTKNELEKLI
tara:strand:- start:1196 stop:1612 length:417 start_codon:yes stop_codon:yes gene_type:complete